MTLVTLPVPIALVAVVLVSAAAALAVTFGLRAILRPRATDELYLVVMVARLVSLHVSQP